MRHYLQDDREASRSEREGRVDGHLARITSAPRQRADHAWLVLRGLFGLVGVLQVGFLVLIYSIAIDNLGSRSAPEPGGRELDTGPLMIWLVPCPILNLTFALAAHRRSSFWWVAAQACCFTLSWGAIAANFGDPVQTVCLGLSVISEAALIWPVARWAVDRLPGRVGL